MKVPLIFEPNTTAPVYLNGNLAAIPNTEFWNTPPAANDWGETKAISLNRSTNQHKINNNKKYQFNRLTVQNYNQSHGCPEENIGPFIWWYHCQPNGNNKHNHFDYNAPYYTRC